MIATIPNKTKNTDVIPAPTFVKVNCSGNPFFFIPYQNGRYRLVYQCLDMELSIEPLSLDSRLRGNDKVELTAFVPK